MRLKLIYVIAFSIFFSCNKKENRNAGPSPLYPQAKNFRINLEKGYSTNVINGDSIEPLINSYGDTIRTGVPILVKGKVIHPDSLGMPKVFSLKEPSSIIDAHPNVRDIPKGLKVINVEKDSLTTFILKKEQKEQNKYIINSSGDTILTGIPIRVIGNEVSCKHPPIISALKPLFKDAANSDFQYLDIDQGMNSSYVLCISKDKKDNLWLGTSGGGVSMYDGNNFTHYTEKNGLSNNFVRTILEDKKGNLWFGTDGGGISKFDGNNFVHYTEKDGLSNNSVWSSFEDKVGNLWFGTYGGGVIKFMPDSIGNGGFFIHYTEEEGLSKNNVFSILEDKKGSIWLGTYLGGVTQFIPDEIGTSGKFIHYDEKAGFSDKPVFSILEDKEGSLWFSTYGDGVIKYIPDSLRIGGGFINYSMKEGLSDDLVWSSLEDRNGNLWFGTVNGGINKYNGTSFIQYSSKDGLSNNNITSIEEDIAGNLILGTGGGGLVKYDESSFIHYTKEEGLSNSNVWSILEDKKNNIWFGTYGDGVTKYNEKTFVQYKDLEGFSLKKIISIIQDSNNDIWFCTNGDGIIKFTPDSIGLGGIFKKITRNEGLSNNNVWSILEDSKGNIWIGTFNGGVTKYNPNDNLGNGSFTHYTEKEGLTSNIVRSILEDNKGNIWFGTKNGVTKFHEDDQVKEAYFTHFTEKEGLVNNYIRSIFEDSKGNLWFGSIGGGVSRFDGFNFKHFTRKEGLSNNYIYSIHEDPNNNIWISTEKGLNKLTIIENERSIKNISDSSYIINSFDKNDGLKGLDFYSNSVLVDKENRLWWGSGKGLTMLDMDKHSTSKKPPVVYLRQLDINEQFIDFRNIADSLRSKIKFSEIKRYENYPLNLELPFQSNHLTFHFAAIDWSAPHKIQYSYVMEGLNTTWSQPSSEANADYRNLPHGTYNFKIRAIGESGEWSEAFEYEFIIRPPWWHTWWARTAYGLAFILSIWGFVRWRTKQLKERQKELESEVEIATKEIRQQKEEVEHQKEIVEEAHREITDSIAYAKRIQSAILPPLKLVKEHLNDSFILYKPKDVVAGDFYWMMPQEDRILFAAADCTGHGVPGAMVSVVCNNGLNRSVREHGLTDPGQILDKTREIVIAEFEKSEEDVKDGMDIAFCSLEGKTIKYAGAHNSLYIIRKGATEIEEIKANKQPIGKFDELLPYTTHTIKLNSGDSIYLFSDGFVDQFGGDKGKKLKAPNFRKLLLGMQDQPMEKQNQLLDKAFEDWKGTLEQIDDVCVIGVKV